ncbi:MAG: hypothetical protein ABI024_08555 [Vicinamibacterales bacterium]
MTTERYSVETIRDYLLGQLPEPETERLDELSVTDDECAERIRAVEHDLVDAFARGELHGMVLEQFRSTYLTTPQRREATRFAHALQSLGEHSGRGSSAQADGRPTMPVRETRRWRELLPLAAAVLLATASAWLMLDNRTLRERVTSAERARDRQLRVAEAPRTTDTAPPSAGPGPSVPAMAMLVLTPQLRSGSQLPTVALAGGTGDLAVQLDLEPVDFPAYEAALLTPTGGQILWRSDRLIARTAGDRKRIALGLPAAILRPQAYLIRVSGVPARGASEIVGEYRFAVVRQTFP